MIPVVQTFYHKPEEGQWGDCHRAAICSIFEMDPEMVPNFGHGGPDGVEFQRREDEWLATQGMVPIRVPFKATDLEEMLLTAKNLFPNLYYLLGGQSRTGVDHTVVGLNDKIVHDPSRNASGIVGPCEDGFYWLTFFGTDRALEK